MVGRMPEDLLILRGGGVGQKPVPMDLLEVRKGTIKQQLRASLKHWGTTVE